MAAVGTVLLVTETLFAALQSPELIDICSRWGYRSELKKLKNTVSVVGAVFLDAESKHDHELSNEARDWIEKLKDAVYDADDLLDEVATLAHQKQLLKGGKIPKEVRVFFSRYNQVGVAYTTCHAIKKIREQLDAIARYHTQFGIGVVNNEPIGRNKETSYVYEQNVIGREDDKKAVIDMLLDPHVEGNNVSFVTIVGIGGLGKTALAQLVYNDKMVEDEFPLRMWVCVSDQDPKHLDIKAVICKILESATKKKPESFELEWVQGELRKELEGKKYLLVLDDVWNEDRDQCLELGQFLMGGGKGSRIVVTTRSKETAKVIGNGRTYELQGLSNENSWYLFERLAFDRGQADLNPYLVVLGKEIVEKCANVPLAIRVVGTLLYGKSKTEWRAIQRKGLAKVRGDEGDITHVLKLSYYHLDTHLKSCFSYCAIFPKDYVMDKMKLIGLWMAQGYVEPLYKGQSIYDAGEEYFSILLRRCFFQDVQTDEDGEIRSCKMHDLMHDIAQEVAGNEICDANSITSKINVRTRHVFAVKQECVESRFAHTKIRTYLKGMECKSPPIPAIVRNWKCLRALEFHDSDIKELPCSIGRLLHLRYLDLSYNLDLDRLPKEITKLHNLQTLLLSGCSRLKELPSDLSKLANLRVLDIEGCNALTFMPCGINKLTGLCKLPLFVVAEVNSSSKKQGVGQLEDIGALTDLKGGLTIKIHENATYVKENGKGGFLKNKEHLSSIFLHWIHDKIDEKDVHSDKVLAEELQPHPNLERLILRGYHDVEKPSWATGDNLKTFLPNLVSLKLCGCERLEDLPMLSTLPFLKQLDISELPNLVYMENSSASSYEFQAIRGSGTGTTEVSFFLSLKSLYLGDLPKLKAWWRGDTNMDDDDDDNSNNINMNINLSMLLSFPRLSHLGICRCPRLTSMPLCPKVKEMTLRGFNETLQIMKMNTEVMAMSAATPSSSGDPLWSLRYVRTDDAQYLRSVPMQAFQCLSEMFIDGDNKLENLSIVEEVFRSCSSSLRALTFYDCPKLRTLCGALEHLTALQSLSISISTVPGNDMSVLEEDNAIPWSALNSSLRSLEINCLPKGIQHLTSLQSLIIVQCTKVETLPEWISCLSSLQNLRLHGCWRLKSLPDGIQKLTSLRQFHIRECSPQLWLRCQSPDGQDWPKIQHIPHFSIMKGRCSTESSSSIICNQDLPQRLSDFSSRPTIMQVRYSEGRGMREDGFLEPIHQSRWKMLSLALSAIVRMRTIVKEKAESKLSDDRHPEKHRSQLLGLSDAELEMMLYCCLFDNNYEFEREKLVQLWIAAKLLQNEPLEDDGQHFFDFLVQKNIFLSRVDNLTQMRIYKVNLQELYASFALIPTITKFLERSEDGNMIANRVADSWHISVQSGTSDHTIFEILKKYRNLRTLIFLKGSLIKQVPYDLFSGLKSVTILDLSGSSITELPSSIGDAKELCYLDLSRTPIKRLPQSIDCLQKLQTLRLKDCVHLSRLPQGIKELVNLRHLDFDVLGQLSFMPRGIGALVKLRTLPAFIVDSEESCNIRELKHMNNLSGKFCISGLEHVLNCEDAMEVDLINKEHLKQLELRWSDIVQFHEDEEQCFSGVLECLKPSFELEELQILCFPGLLLPSWISDPQYIKLVSITLFKCETCHTLPSLGQLPKLKSLDIIEMNRVKIIDDKFCGVDMYHEAFPMLEMLSMDGMLNLEAWMGVIYGACPRLVKLSIKRCPQLREVDSFRYLCSLKHLEVTHCPLLESLPVEMLTSPLETVVIDACPMLERRYSQEGKDSSQLRHVPNVWIDSDDTQSSNEDDTQDVDSVRGNSSLKEIHSSDEEAFEDDIPMTGENSTSTSSSMTPSVIPRLLQPPDLKIFSFSNLKKATGNFQYRLGEGGFGTVFKGWVDELSYEATKPGKGMIVAVKVKQFKLESFGYGEVFIEEVKNLQKLNHPHIVKLIGYCSENSQNLLVYEFMPLGSLDSHLFRRSSDLESLSWSIRMKIALGAAKGLAFLHSVQPPVIHEDIQPSHVLLDLNYDAKLCGFGMARDGPTGDESQVSTRAASTGFMALEDIATGHLSTKTDVYGFGVVILEMICGLRVYDMNRSFKENNLVKWARPYLADKTKLPHILDNRLEGQYQLDTAFEVFSLAFRCLANDPEIRPTMEEVVKELEQLLSFSINKGKAILT